MKVGKNESDASVLDRALGLVTRVRPGEGLVALLLSLNVCLLLSAYYVIKPVREALILAGSGAEVKSYAAVGQTLLLAMVIPAYGALASRVSRRVLIPLVTGIFIACLLLFYLAAQAQFPFLGVVFYLWVGIFNVMVIAQFWGFANDVYSKEQGERLFPIVAFGASIGAVVGSQLTSLLIEELGTNQMLLVSGAILVLSIGLTRVVESILVSRSPSPSPSLLRPGEPDAQETTADAEPMSSRHGSFRLVMRSPYLLLIAGLMLLANLVNTTGEFILGSALTESATAAVQAGTSGGLSVSDYIGAYYARFFFWVNVAGVVLQLLFVSRIIQFVGVRGALLVLPIISLGTYGAIAALPVLGVIRWTKTAENATDYSLQNTVRQALFLPLSREEKYQAKQVIDAFFVRGGDVLSAALVALGLHVLDFGTQGFALTNVLLVAIWLFVALRIGQLYASGKTGPRD